MAQEFRRGAVCDGFEYFAAMPPLAALRLMVALHVTSRVPSIDGGWLDRAPDAVMGLLDVKRAHFCSQATRALHVELPAECNPQREVGRLITSMCGCRDAGVNWERELAQVMDNNGFRRGSGSLCARIGTPGGESAAWSTETIS